MPCLVLIIGSLFIKAFSMWLKLQDVGEASRGKHSENKKSEMSEKGEKDKVTHLILFIHTL